MIGLFDIAANDQSIYYLGQLFGSVGNVFTINPAQTVMGAIYKTLNTTALVLGSLMVIHTIVIGLIKTAHEGEFLGKQWSSLWVPFRTVMGIAALFPTPSGYSVLQICMMWFIVQGVGAADTLWNTVLNYVSHMGSPYASMSPPSAGLHQTLEDLLQALVCQAEAVRTDKDTYTANGATNPYFYCADPNVTKTSPRICTQEQSEMLNITSNPSSTIINGAYNYQIGPGGACGTLVFGDPKTYATGSDPTPVCSKTDLASLEMCAAVTAQVPALQSVVSTLGQFAATIAEFDHEYMYFYQNYGSKATDFLKAYCTGNNIQAANCCTYNSAFPQVGACLDIKDDNYFPYLNASANNITDYGNASQNAAANLYWKYALAPILGNNPDILGTNANYILSNIQAAITTVLLAQPPSLTTWEADAQSTGWLLAGAYYYKIAGMNASNQTSSVPTIGVTTADFTPTQSNNAMAVYRNNYTATGDIVNAITSASKTTLSSSTPPQMAGPGNVMGSAMSGMLSNFESNLTSNTTNPLVGAQAFGESLLVTAQISYPIFLAACSIVLVVASLMGMGLGSGLTSNPAELAVLFLVYSTWTVFMLYCGWCLTLGGMLAIYAPLIPYIIFTFGSIGWFISTVEAMTAAPFVALGILSPNGQHELLGKAEPAIMILLNTFLRPSLMIMGMMAAMLLCPLMVQMVNAGFNSVVGSIYGNGNLSPIESILFITAYSTLIITVMNKCFSLISIIPERVLTYIGAQASGAGEAESLGAVKSGQEGATAKMKSTASSVGDKTLAGAGRGNAPKEKPPKPEPKMS